MPKRRPKDIGTAAETAAVRHLNDHGFPGAERLPLKGSRDIGDIGVTAGIIAEVKAGAAAATASNKLIADWLAQTETERLHAGADIGILIVRQHRRPVGQWHVWMPLHTLHFIVSGETLLPQDAPQPVMMLLDHWCELARKEWGDT